MATARELKKQRDQNRRERERDARKADRARLKMLRARIRAAKQHGTKRRREVVAICRVGRRNARELAKAIRERKRLEANAEIEAAKLQSQRTCDTSKTQTRVRNEDTIRRAQAAYEAENQHQGTLRRYAKPARLNPEERRRRRIDAIQESDAEVLANIPHELIPAWEAKKQGIKATPRRTRTETFLEWAQEHPADVLVILDRQFAKDVDRLVADEKELRRDVMRPRSYRKMQDAELLRRYEAYSGAPEVPF